MPKNIPLPNDGIHEQPGELSGPEAH